MNLDLKAVNYRHIKDLSIALFAAAVFLCSCEKDPPHTGIIRPVVKSLQTKSGPMIIEDDRTHNDNAGTNCEKISSKGFIVDAWLESEGFDHTAEAAVPVHYINGRKATYSDRWDIEGAPRWVYGILTRFWCWNTLAPDSGLDTGSDYTNASDSRDFSFNVPAMPSDRRDIILAYTQKTWTESRSDDVDLRFFHPLVNICFRLSPSFSESLEVTQITLKDVFTSGSFSFTGNSAESSASQDASFSWTGLANKTDLTETVTARVTDVNFFIPEQAPGPGTAISATFRRKTDGAFFTGEASVYDSADPSMQNWTAGKYYCYQLKATDTDNNNILFGFDDVIIRAWVDNSAEDIYEFMP